MANPGIDVVSANLHLHLAVETTNNSREASCNNKTIDIDIGSQVCIKAVCNDEKVLRTGLE